MSIKHRIVLPMTTEEEYRNADVPGPSDLEEVIKRLEFRNEKLHKHIIKLEDDLIKEREEHIKLKQKINDLVNEYRNKGRL